MASSGFVITKSRRHACVSFSCGNLKRKNLVVRIHSACLFGEMFGSRHCDCREQLRKTLKLIKKNGSGVLVYDFSEGRGHGLENKIKAMELERLHKIDSLEAMKKLGLNADKRHYKTSIGALNDLGASKRIKLVSGNPKKASALKEAGFETAQTLKLKICLTKYNKAEVLMKKNKLGYNY